MFSLNSVSKDSNTLMGELLWRTCDLVAGALSLTLAPLVVEDAWLKTSLEFRSVLPVISLRTIRRSFLVFLLWVLQTGKPRCFLLSSPMGGTCNPNLYSAQELCESEKVSRTLSMRTVNFFLYGEKTVILAFQISLTYFLQTLKIMRDFLLGSALNRLCTL